MPESHTVLGLITARGGSRGIPRKNIKLMAGKPLIVWTIEAALASKFLTRIVVSTDDEEIASIARDAGADVPFMRPSALAQDDSTSLEVVHHALETLRTQGETYDAVMILQPTSPLRTAEDIDTAVQKMQKTGADSVMGMVELSDFSAKKVKTIDGDTIAPFFEEEGKTSAARSQGRHAYKRNAAIYLTRTDLLLRHDLFGKDSRAIIMPRERSVDVNDGFDWLIAEALLHQRHVL